jgi:mono/diheme cytochrome c family protein
MDVAMRGIAIATLLAASACGRVASGSNDGAGVFAAACASCHGERGTPPVQMTQQLGVRDLASPEFIARRTREVVIEQVRRGAANGRMPAFSGALTDAQIQAVADHVMSLAPAR